MEECRSEVVIPEITETAEISTRTVETGTVRVTKLVYEVERTFTPELHDQIVKVERVPVNRVIKNPPEVEIRGDTTIVPVVEEVMVKLLLLKEEIHITRQTSTKACEAQNVTLRREEVRVDREQTPRLEGPRNPG